MASEREVLVLRAGRRTEGVPADIEHLDLLPLGSRQEVRQAIDSSFQAPLWQDLWSAVIDGEGWMMEANLHVEEPVRKLMLRIHGAGDPTSAIAGLCRTRSWDAIDVSAWEFIDISDPSTRPSDHRND